MISTGGSFLSVWRMVNCLTTILPKSAERREPPAHTRRKKAQLQNLLDAFRYMVLNDQAFDPLRAASIQIRLDSS